MISLPSRGPWDENLAAHAAAASAFSESFEIGDADSGRTQPLHRAAADGLAMADPL